MSALLGRANSAWVTHVFSQTGLSRWFACVSDNSWFTVGLAWKICTERTYLSLRIFEHLFYGNLGWLKSLSQKLERFAPPTLRITKFQVLMETSWAWEWTRGVLSMNQGEMASTWSWNVLIWCWMTAFSGQEQKRPLVSYQYRVTTPMTDTSS